MALKQNVLYRQEALQLLRGRWAEAVIFTLVYFIISSAIGAIPGVNVLASFLISAPIGWSFEVGFLHLRRGDELRVEGLFTCFKDYGRILSTVLLMLLYIVAWMMLLVVPGIIKGYSYAMTNYILLDNPEMRNNGAIELSMKMMEGNKMKLFLLDLSFIGWILLSILTCGIGFLWLQPYMMSARAAFYEDLKAQPVDYNQVQPTF